jgi:CDP-diacylglycerol--glycerol-3-phosphate 3-phosphatidyltransferase
LSSANLATSYFTNRQDRYIHFRSHPSLLSYLSSLTRLYTHYSYLLSPSPSPSVSRHHLVPLPCPPGSPSTPAALIWPVPSIHPRQFAQHALATLSAFQNSWRASNTARLRRVDVDTWFWPVIQAGVLGIKEEEAAMDKVWRAVRESHGADADAGVGAAPVEVDLTSGYFGLYKAYKRAVIDSPAPVRVIAASPRVSRSQRSQRIGLRLPRLWRLADKYSGQRVLRFQGVLSPHPGRLHPPRIALPSRCRESRT